MTTRIAPLLAAAALLAACTTAFAAKVPPGAENTKKCGNVATSNGGKAQYIRASKVSCTTAKTVAKRAKGKNYSANGFGCTFYTGIYRCQKGKGAVAFQYKKPARK